MPDSFQFNLVTTEDVKKEVLKLNMKKLSTLGTIPTTILTQTIDVHIQSHKSGIE